jgi:NhaP-type Na+/H+ or K+/H+ antiporter
LPEQNMRRRTKITLALAAITSVAIGGTYALVAEHGVPAGAAAATGSTTTATTRTTSQQGVAPSTGQSGQNQRPARAHARTRSS